MKIGFVGAGKVGFSLGKYFRENGLEITGYYDVTGEYAHEAAEFTKSRYFDRLENLVEESDAMFLTVSDGAIGTVWEEIKYLSKKISLESKCICHCSGAMSSDVFVGISETGASGYSIHPLLAINDKLQSYKELSQAYFTIEGDVSYIDYWVNLFSELGNRVTVIDKKDKPKYHGAAVFASNLVVGLYEYATDILKECGFADEDAQKALLPLFIGNACNLKQGAVKALTGPVERADADTIKKHLDVFDGDKALLYKLLSRRITETAMEKNPERDYENVINILK